VPVLHSSEIHDIGALPAALAAVDEAEDVHMHVNNPKLEDEPQTGATVACYMYKLN